MYDNYDEDFFLEDTYYTVGMNGGTEFSKLLYDGKKSMFGRPQVAFVTEDSSTKITINPSYHSFTLEAKQTFPMPSDFNKTKQKGDNNGKTHSITSRWA